jgi:cytoskeleton protein RodZ
MSDQVASTPAGAGALLRAAREAKGIRLDHLASLLKVPEGKLSALEEERYEALPGLAFVRALAQSVCRQLDVEPQPILDALPKLAAPSAGLEHVTRGLATPFQIGQARLLPGLPMDLPRWIRPGILVPILLLLLAAGFWFGPGSGVWKRAAVQGAAGDAASAAEFSVSTVGLASGALAASAPPAGVGAVGALTAGAIASSSAAALRDPGSVPAVVGAGSSITVTVPLGSQVGASGQSNAAVSGAALVLRANQSSWVEVRDANTVLLSRVIAAGEAVPLDGVGPFKLKIGNAVGMSLTFRGQAVDLAAATKDNVARLELK